jgi:hypothetical protein
MMDGSRQMAQSQGKKPAISIDEATDGSRQVILRPENNDVFIRTGKQVIAGCNLGISVDLWLDELHSLIAFVSDWTKNHSTTVEACFIEPRPRCVMLVFVPISKSFNFELADELVELNAKLIKDFNVGMVEIHQIPQDELGHFLDPSAARLIYGDPRKTHIAVEA